MWLTTAVLAIILAYTWYVDPRAPRGFAAVPMFLVGTLTIWRAARTRDWGLDRRALLPGLAASALVTVPAVIAILLAGAALGTLHDRRDFLGTFGGLFVWAAAQQWVLQTVVLREAQRVVPQRWAIPIAAALFAIVHLPNPFLTGATLAGGLAWCTIYARHPNIVPLAISHALGTLAILHAFDPDLTGRLRIGQSYLQLGS
jgi:membrane protease YdiL (CAAX protease family)